MALDPKGLEAFREWYRRHVGKMLTRANAERAITAYLSAVSPPDNGEAVAWQVSGGGSITTEKGVADTWVSMFGCTVRPLYAHPAALQPVPDNGGDLLATMAKHLGWELDWGPRDSNDEEGEFGWRVHECSGNRSDREWTLIGFGASPLEALRQAAAPSHNEGRE